MFRIHGCREIPTELHKYLDKCLKINQSTGMEKAKTAWEQEKAIHPSTSADLSGSERKNSFQFSFGY